MKDFSNAYQQRKKNINWKRIVTTSFGLILNEGDYYILRNGEIVYLMDNLCISDVGNRPFYMKSKNTGKTVGTVTWEGKYFNRGDDEKDIVGVYSRPSLTTANSI